jgi:hypothetical protein
MGKIVVCYHFPVLLLFYGREKSWEIDTISLILLLASLFWRAFTIDTNESITSKAFAHPDSREGFCTKGLIWSFCGIDTKMSTPLRSHMYLFRYLSVMGVERR